MTQRVCFLNVTSRFFFWTLSKTFFIGLHESKDPLQAGQITTLLMDKIGPVSTNVWFNCRRIKLFRGPTYAPPPWEFSTLALETNFQLFAQNNSHSADAIRSLMVHFSILIHYLFKLLRILFDIKLLLESLSCETEYFTALTITSYLDTVSRSKHYQKKNKTLP